MSSLDTVKELGRMATTATLTKDVIDLFSQKVELLEKQVATLEQENASLKAEKSNLQKKITDLEEQLDRLQPKEELHPDAIRLLQLLFQRDNIRISEIAALLGIQKGMAEFHCDVLLAAKMIGLPMIVTMGQEVPYHICPKGREYLVKHGHV
jgi:predicted RNase H-like nuclease (RuvC/YqgF family)